MSAIDYHRRILADELRNEAFEKALKQAVKPGSSVSDIGAGTGYLSFLAKKFGAGECILYEAGPVLALAKKIARQSNISGLAFVAEHSATVELPTRTDVVVTETLGNFALEEHIIENWKDAQRMVKDNGVILPQELALFACPVTSDRFYKELTEPFDALKCADFSAAKIAALNAMYVRTFTKEDLLEGGKAAKQYDQLSCNEDLQSQRTADVLWKLPVSATIYGFAMWWECMVSKGNALNTSPLKPITHWEQVYLPVLEPIPLKKNEELTLQIKTDTRWETGLSARWMVKAPSGMQGLSMDHGL